MRTCADGGRSGGGGGVGVRGRRVGVLGRGGDGKPIWLEDPAQEDPAQPSPHLHEGDRPNHE